MIITYKYRVKDKHIKELNRQARAVNFVWNYCNETQIHAVKSGRRWLYRFDLCTLTSGTSKKLGISSHTIQEICRYYDKSKLIHNKPWLKFRGKKSLGWIPFTSQNLMFKNKKFHFYGKKFEVFLSRIPPTTKFRGGSFNQDPKGHWYLNIWVDIFEKQNAATQQVGIDLGIKSLATLSTGQEIENPRYYANLEQKLAKANRANKKKQIKNINTKIKNRRKDFLHKQSKKLTNEFGLIFIGDVSSSKLAKTKLSKSILDSGWSDFKTMLQYKSIMNGGKMIEVSEAYTSQICSNCLEIPDSRPTGIAGLGIREWICSNCDEKHNRDVNAAKNILRIGQNTLAGGIRKIWKLSNRVLD